MNADRLKELPVDMIERNPNQPRTHFDRVELRRLATSIQATNGVIQPIVVTRRGPSWLIVAGERRWRAAQLVGMETILCRIIDQIDDRVLAQYALLENLDRVDLTPMEIGRSYARLADEYGMRQTEIASIVGRDRTEINRYIALTRLPPEIQEYIDQGELSVGHAKVLLGAPENERYRLGTLCVRQGWSVRQLERQLDKSDSAIGSADLKANQDLADRLGERIGAACSIRPAGQGRWVLKIESYASDVLVGTLQGLAQAIDESSQADGRVTIEVSGKAGVFDFLSDSA